MVSFRPLILYLGVCLLVLAIMTTSSLGEAWTPSEVDLIAWYDASETNTITETGGVVSEWADRSTNSWWSLTSAGSPMTGTRTINGLNVLDFDGSSSIGLGYGSSVKITNGEFSVFMVTAIDDATNANAAIWSYHKESANWFELRAKDTSFSGQAASSGIGVSGDLTGGPYKGHTNIFNMVFDKTTAAFFVYVDGTNRLTDAGYGGVGFRHIFVYYGWKTLKSPDGAVGEVIISPDCSEDTRQRIEGHLAWKWGLQGNLPPDHPYKNGEPWIGFRGTVLIIR